MIVNTLPPMRRVVTGFGPDGRSRFIEDGPSPATLLVPERPGYRNCNIWRTVGGPTPVAAPDSITEHRGVLPPPGGTVIRVIDIPPRHPDPEVRRRMASASLTHLFPDAAHAKEHKVPGMHETRTIDYAIILSGTLTAILEDGETDLHAGDILVQRATNHAWENRTESMVRVCFVLVDGA